jgi:hypothetical protein
MGLVMPDSNTPYLVVPKTPQNRDSVVSIVTSYRLNNLGVRVRIPVGSRIFSSPSRPGRLWGPPNLLSNGYQGSFVGGDRPEHEADKSPPASAEVKKM